MYVIKYGLDHTEEKFEKILQIFFSNKKVRFGSRSGSGTITRIRLRPFQKSSGNVLRVWWWVYISHLSLKMGNTRSTCPTHRFYSLWRGVTINLHMGFEGLKMREGVGRRLQSTCTWVLKGWRRGWRGGGGGSRINPPTESNCLVVVTAPLNTDNHDRTVQTKIKTSLCNKTLYSALF